MHIIRFLLILLITTPILYAATSPSAASLTVRGQIPWTNQESYTPVLVHLESNIDDTISLELKAYGNTIKASRTVVVKAGQHHTETVLLPTSLSSINHVEIHWKSSKGHSGQASSSASLDYRETNVIVVDRDKSLLGNEFLNKIDDPRFSYRGQKYIDLESNVIPEYWQGIPLWLTLLITPSAERNLNQAQVKALQQWHHAGGAIFFSTEDLRNTWQHRGVDGSVANETANNKEFENIVTQHNAQTRVGINQYQVPGTDDVPTGSFIFLLVLFIVIVGPTNYMWVRRHHQLHLFLITTPVISFIFCIVLAVFGLLSDGLSAHRSVIELTWINHQQKQSCTWTSISWFSGLSPGAIHLSNDSEIRILDDDCYDEYNHERKSLSAIWGSEQIVSGEWLLSRTHQQIQICTPQPEERRFIIKPDKQGFTLTNGFDRAIKNFQWVDSKGNIWTATNIASGQSMPLVQSPNSTIRLDLECKRFSANAQQIWKSSSQKLHFRAIMDQTLHDIPGPSATDEEPPFAMVCGTLEAIERK